jgi:hypothetical protein
MKTKEQKVLELLRRRKNGAMNTELNQICFRYGARIADLRGKRYIIETKRKGEGLYSYKLIHEPKL